MPKTLVPVVAGGKINTTTNGNAESNKEDSHLPDVQAVKKDKAKANSKTLTQFLAASLCPSLQEQLKMVVLAIIAIFLLLMIIGAIVYFLKCRENRTRRSRFDERRVSTPSPSADSEILEPSEASIVADEPVEAPPPPPIIENQPVKAKRGGFTKQQFDECE